ncbi:MAG: ABC transporter ATP-binding protein [Methylotenera sp.]|nr:ABC transporter ATP-binding protein [Oligoflexia bacterium]
MIQFKNVSKSYQNRLALNHISLTVESGTTTVLIGSSGCGKSTLLRAVTGLVNPDSGEIFLNEVRLTSQTLPELRSKIGYVIQEGGLFPHLTAEKNLQLMPKLLGWNMRKIRERINELAELTALPIETMQSYPSELSGGQRQRVSLMRALMLDPQILLLDEPLGALDPIIRRELQEDLREIFRRLKKTVLLVTHDLGEAGFFGDRIVLMKNGTLVQQGSLSDLVQRPADAFVTEFVNAQRSPLEELVR